MFLQDGVLLFDVAVKGLRQVIPGEQVYFERQGAFLKGILQVGQLAFLSGRGECNQVQVRVWAGVPSDAGAIRPDGDVGQMRSQQPENDALLLGSEVNVGVQSHVSPLMVR